MKYILSLLILFCTIITHAQTGSVNVGAIRSRVTDSTTVSTPSGYGILYFNTQSNKWRYYDGTTWRSFSDGGSSYTFGNGITESAGNVGLGGALSSIVNIDGSYDFNIGVNTQLPTIQLLSTAGTFQSGTGRAYGFNFGTTTLAFGAGAGHGTNFKIDDATGTVFTDGIGGGIKYGGSGYETTGNSLTSRDYVNSGTATLTNKTWNGGLISGQYGGTGVNNSGKTITLGGNLVTSGAFSTTLTATGTTTVTLPVTGTLATLNGSETLANKTLVSPVLGAATATSINTVVISGSSTPTLAVTGTTTISGTHSGTSSGTNTGDQTNITGNAATVTTNANLTGPITSVGNATTIASSVNLPGSPTTTTPASDDNSTKIPTTGFVQAAIPVSIRKSFAYHDPHKSIIFYGDSYTLDNQATTTQRGFTAQISAALSQVATVNLAVSGTGYLRAAAQAYANVSPGNTATSRVFIGFNDLRDNGNTTSINPPTNEKMKGGVRAITAITWLSSAVAANNGGVSTTGTWTTTSGINDYASAKLSGLVRTSIVSGSTLSYTFSLTTSQQGLVIGTFGTDESTVFGGDFTYAIDGGTPITWSPKNKTDGKVDGSASALSPNTIFITGLTSGSHTVVITTLSTAVTRIDYFGILQDSRSRPPVIICSIPKQTATGYTIPTHNFGSNAVFDSGNTALLSVVTELSSDNSSIFFSDTNRFWDPAIHVGADDIHPNDLGYYILSQATYSVLRPDFSKGYESRYNYLSDNISYIRSSGDAVIIAASRHPYTATFFNASRAAAQYHITGGPNDGNHQWFVSPTNNTTPTVAMTLDKNGGLFLGYATPVATERFGFRTDQNAGTSLAVINAASGTAATSSIVVSNSSTLGSGLVLRTYSNGFTTSGSAIANSSALIASTTAGLNVVSLAGVGFYTNTTLAAANISTAGNLSIGNGTTAANSRLQVTGSLAVGRVAKTANYTLDISDHTVEYTTAGVTATLPTAIGIDGRMYMIKNMATSGVVTIATTSSQTIDGAAPGTLAPGMILRVQSNGANWINLNNGNLFAVNAATVGLSSATLNSTYPDVPIGFRVICGAISLGGAIYTKYTEAGSSDVWLMSSSPVAP